MFSSVSKWLKFFTVVSILLFAADMGFAKKKPPLEKADSGNVRMDAYFDMSLKELLRVDISLPFSLIPTESRLTPAAVTKIDQIDVKSSGARNLDELLDIYVPGFQYMKKASGNMIGIRGINSDRNNKMLMLVNGRNMNIKVRDGGAFSERHLSMLGDIKQIAVMRGPGSAVSGPGAIAGVINIETFNGLNYQGGEVQARYGAVEEFKSLEAKYGKKLTDGLGLFLYYGVDDYEGADQDDAGLIFSSPFTAGDGSYTPTGQSVSFNVNNSNDSYNDRLRHKAHLQLTGKDFDTWFRYTRGGMNTARPRVNYISYSDPEDAINSGGGYDQLTIFGDYQKQINTIFKLDVQLSFDTADVVMEKTKPDKYWREDEYLARTMATLTPFLTHKTAVGFEYSHELFGKQNRNIDDPSKVGGKVPPGTEWSTDMYSFLSEHQWTISNQWLAIIGLRADKHTYTPWMYSPRAALILTPDEKNTWKLIYNHSVRRSDDADLYDSYLRTNKLDTTETLDNFELRFERPHTNHLFFGASAYYNIHHQVSWNQRWAVSDKMGKLQTAGLEIEASYRTKKTRFSFSHSYTKHLDFDLERDDMDINSVSASPYGYGDDLANWSNHVSKLSIRYDLNDQWSTSGSIRVYWGYPGGQDMADYHQEELGGTTSLPLYADGETRAFKESVFLNMGIEYKPTDLISIALHGFNLLGLFDEDLNKRNFFQQTSQYRQEAPGLALTARFSF